MSSSIKLSKLDGYFLCLIVLFVGMGIQVDAQFFTKSSKSIPRMGRRSDQSVSAPSQLHHQALIDSLVDELGPDMLEALGQIKVTQNKLGEMAYTNEQPFDLRKVDEPDTMSSFGSSLSRDERSSRSPYRDSSLAMRAMNIDRFIKYLASGQPPMSYDRLFRGRDIRGEQKEQKFGVDK